MDWKRLWIFASETNIPRKIKDTFMSVRTISHTHSQSHSSSSGRVRCPTQPSKHSRCASFPPSQSQTHFSCCQQPYRERNSGNSSFRIADHHSKHCHKMQEIFFYLLFFMNLTLKLKLTSLELVVNTLSIMIEELFSRFWGGISMTTIIRQYWLLLMVYIFSHILFLPCMEQRTLRKVWQPWWQSFNLQPAPMSLWHP